MPTLKIFKDIGNCCKDSILWVISGKTDKSRLAIQDNIYKIQLGKALQSKCHKRNNNSKSPKYNFKETLMIDFKKLNDERTINNHMIH